MRRALRRPSPRWGPSKSDSGQVILRNCLGNASRESGQSFITLILAPTTTPDDRHSSIPTLRCIEALGLRGSGYARQGSRAIGSCELSTFSMNGGCWARTHPCHATWASLMEIRRFGRNIGHYRSPRFFPAPHTRLSGPTKMATVTQEPSGANDHPVPNKSPTPLRL
jgi:hypothetical protein